MQTGFWKMHGLCVRKSPDFEGLHAVEKGSGRFRRVGISIHHRAGNARRIPFLATGNAGMAADTGVEVNNQGKLRHLPSPLTNACHLPRAGSIPDTRGWVSNCGEVCFGSLASAL